MRVGSAATNVSETEEEYFLDLQGSKLTCEQAMHEGSNIAM
jgi:hypothetical protein